MRAAGYYLTTTQEQAGVTQTYGLGFQTLDVQTALIRAGVPNDNGQAMVAAERIVAKERKTGRIFYCRKNRCYMPRPK